MKTADPHASLVINNRIIKCAAGLYSVGSTCKECVASCASCHDETTCLACNSSTLANGACGTDAGASSQTHNGIVSCADGFTQNAGGDGCVLCASLFGDSCQLCTREACLRCDDKHVLDAGVCRVSPLCSVTDGIGCAICMADTISFNATDCVKKDACEAFVNGNCVMCGNGTVLENGTCDTSTTCPIEKNGACLRCVDGMFADDHGVCERRAEMQ